MFAGTSEQGVIFWQAKKPRATIHSTKGKQSFAVQLKPFCLPLVSPPDCPVRSFHISLGFSFLTLFTRKSAPNPAMFPLIAPATHGTTLAPELSPRVRLNSLRNEKNTIQNEKGVWAAWEWLGVFLLSSESASDV